MRGLRIGVVGATGAVGETALEILCDPDVVQGLEIESIRAFASRASAGKPVQCGSRRLTVEVFSEAAGESCDVLFFATESSLSSQFIPQLAAKGVLCIDKSSAFRMDAHVPLVVPEVNGEELARESLRQRPIVANPNCCTAPLTVALAPLQNQFGLKRVIVSTYQSVSGAGKRGVDTLLEEARDFLRSEDPGGVHASDVFPKPIAFNVFPFVASLDEQGHTDEEAKIVEEARKILGRPDLPIAATSVRVPTFVSHAESVTIELERKTTAAELESVLAAAPGLELIRYENNSAEAESDVLLFPTPRDAHGKDPVFVGRIREVAAFNPGFGFSLWVVADNLRKGAALNGVQIMMHAVKTGLISELVKQRGSQEP